VAVEGTGVAAGSGESRIWLLSTDRLGLIEGGRYRTACGGFYLDPLLHLSAVLLPLPSGAVYFGKGPNLLRFDPQQQTVEPMGRRNGLLNDGATDLCLDREGNVWIAGLRGVSKLVPTPFVSFRVSDGLLEDEVTAVCEPWPGTLLLGHSSGLTFFEDSGLSTLLFNSGTDAPRTQWRVLDLAPDGEGNCWIAGNALGLARLSRDRRLTWFGGLPLPVTSVRVQPSGAVVVSTWDGIFRLEGRRFERLAWTGKAAPQSRRILSGQNGTFYLATSGNGLWLADGERLTRVPGLETVDERQVVSVLENRDGSAWVGTWAGLFLLRDGRLERPAPPLNQVADPLYFVTRDHQDRLWFGTNDGVLRWDGEELKRFGIREGLAGRETNRAAGFVDSRSRIWVGTETGLSFFVGDESSENVPPPLTTIAGLYAADKPVDLDKPAELGHRRNTLVFDFSAISFTDELAVRYQYYLEGFDETWLDEVPAATRWARYTNLPAGNYRFHLRAAGAPGVWSEDVSSPWITILKPFWLRWWFFLAVAAVLLQVGYWAVVAGSRKRYARRLTEEVAARTAELEESREHYRLLFHGAAVPKLILDVDDGVVLDANRAADELCGLTVGGLTGRQPLEGGPSWLAEMLGLCRNRDVGEEELQVTGQLPAADGEPRDVEAWGARLTLHGRKCVLVTAMDVTSRRRLEVEQLRASKLDLRAVIWPRWWTRRSPPRATPAGSPVSC